MLNFRILNNYPKAAVRCVTKSQASILCDEMYNQYPSFMRYFKRGETKWDIISSDIVCYAPHIYDGEESHMQLTTEKYWSDRGYTILPFEALLEQVQDFGEIVVSNFSLDELFEPEV